MNYLIIILAIIVILLVYYIYTVVTATPVVGKNIDLTQPPVVIKSSTITNPYSANYSVGVWVFISNFTQNSQIGRFLTYGTTANPKMFSLRMDTGKPLLYCDILVNDITKTPKYTTQSVQLTSENESFPIQKWTYVVVSVSNTFIECYLNGRFVSASKVDTNGLYVLEPAVGADIESGPTFRFGAKGTKMEGGSIRSNGCPVVITGLSRWDAPLSAGDIYNNYMKGNGNNSSIWGSAYHMDVNLKQAKNVYTLPVF
jgi:Concanavalin A-like lectin/glucanases superfamily